MTGPEPADPVPDQARLPLFRVLLVLQTAVAALLGGATFLLPGVAGGVAGYPATEHFYYRLAGAATLGYAAMAFLAYRERAPWRAVRIPLAATLAFNAAAVLASVLGLAEGDMHWPVFFVLVAAFAFTLVTAYWLRRDEGPPLAPATPVAPAYRVLLVVATLAAAFFGVAPLVLARLFARIGGFSTDELFLLRQAAAATLGYAVAGALELRAASWSAVRLPTVGALIFNALSAVAAAQYLGGGGRSPVAALILLAATAFSIGFVWAMATHERAAGQRALGAR